MLFKLIIKKKKFFNLKSLIFIVIYKQLKKNFRFHLPVCKSGPVDRACGYYSDIHSSNLAR